MHVLPFSSFLVCPKFLGRHQEFSCHRFPSLVEQRELCRYTSESAGVARLAPCPIGRPSLPARYALGVGERCGRWSASQWHTTPPLRLRPHQRFLPPASAPLQSSLRFLPDLLSAPPSVHLAMYFPPCYGGAVWIYPVPLG